ncbi:hypothetical protein M408DRAFT_328872 [Serendipita vermifera MAFF 305830]|uniref:ER membrane protein complex subunit 1 n=1 Tax=Serendipita vermifera MAFF 305830 TaxID=933852 RepID=A0A0C2XJE4_SERVB|nr:hypothetical protein M408DRAFT_328872 [Serendipita vermifera MAFF 305830]
MFIGVPHTSIPALEPRFHRVGSATVPAQAVYLAATNKNVLAALNPSEGNIVWRRQFEASDPIVAFKANQDGLVSLSGNGGATVRLYEVINGKLIWEAHLHDANSGRISSTPAMAGTALEFDTVDVYVLSNGHTIRRLAGATGETLWGYTLPDMGSSTTLTTLTRTQHGLYALGLTTNLRGYTLTVLSFDPDTGLLRAREDLPSTTLAGPQDFVVLKQGTVTPDGKVALGHTAGLVWLEDGTVKEIFLSPGLEGKFMARVNVKKHGPYTQIKGLGVEDKGFFLATLKGKESEQADGSAHIYRMEVNGMGLVKMTDFEPSTDKPYVVYSGGIDRKGHSYISKLAHSSRMKVASYEVFAPVAVNGRGMSTGFTFEYDATTHGAMEFAAIDVVNTSEYVYASRLIISTSTGIIQQYAQETHKWSREESLTDVRAIATVDLPEPSVEAHMVYGNLSESPIERVLRQMKELKVLPAFLFRFFQRFATGRYANPSSPSAATSNNAAAMTSNVGTDGLWRDTYGLKKIVVMATGTGKVFGIETLKGKVIWSIKLGAGSPDLSMKIKPIRMVVLKTASEGFHPEVGLVVEVEQMSPTGEWTTTTGMIRIEATTGASESTIMFRGSVLEVVELDVPVAYQSVNAGIGKKMVGMVDRDQKMHIFPHHEDAVAVFNKISTQASFVLHTGPPTQRALQGLKLSPWVASEPVTNDPNYVPPAPHWKSHSTWRTSFAPGENIIDVVRSATALTGIPPASHGRVLGDRTTLYKYENPHLIAVLTESHVREETSSSSPPRTQCSVYLLDSVKGSFVYSTVIPAARDSLKGPKVAGSASACEVKMSLVENWFVYHYYDDDAHGIGARGWRMVSVELYEGGANVKTRSGELAADSPNRMEVTPIEQTYIFPYDVKALAVTSTKFGISSKDLVVINGKNQVQTYSRRFLDPRRPKGPLTAQDKEEGLVQYDILLPDDPRRVASHEYPLLADSLLTTATQLESTSLVLAYGLDLFMTRVAPSGSFDVLSPEFNKIQLVLTVLGLGIAIIITRPLVKGKIRKGKWYY